MKKTIKLNEKQLSKIIERVIKEENNPRGGFLYSESIDLELIQEIIDRMKEYHVKGKIKGDEEYVEKYSEYVRALKSLNRKFPLQ